MAGAYFLRTSLIGADFTGAGLWSSGGASWFIEADLTNADFSGTYLESWGTTDANLLRFDGSVFYNANFVGATYDPYPISFANADFTCATFDATVATATEIDWTGATCPDGTAADPAGGCAGHLTRDAGCP